MNSLLPHHIPDLAIWPSCLTPAAVLHGALVDVVHDFDHARSVIDRFKAHRGAVPRLLKRFGEQPLVGAPNQLHFLPVAIPLGGVFSDFPSPHGDVLVSWPESQQARGCIGYSQSLALLWFPPRRLLIAELAPSSWSTLGAPFQFEAQVTACMRGISDSRAAFSGITILVSLEVHREKTRSAFSFLGGVFRLSEARRRGHTEDEKDAEHEVRRRLQQYDSIRLARWYRRQRWPLEQEQFLKACGLLGLWTTEEQAAARVLWSARLRKRWSELDHCPPVLRVTLACSVSPLREWEMWTILNHETGIPAYAEISLALVRDQSRTVVTSAMIEPLLHMLLRTCTDLDGQDKEWRTVACKAHALERKLRMFLSTKRRLRSNR